MLAVAVSLLLSIYIVVLIIWIIWQKRSPAATLGWILALLALPYIGFLIFYFFGPHKIKRRRLKRQETRKALLSWCAHSVAHKPILLPENVARIAKVGLTAGGYPPGSCVEVRMLVDGEKTYEAIFDAIRRAERHVHLEYYIFEPDRIGTALRDLLIEKANAGVIVRLLIDALGSKRLTRSFLRPLYEAGAHIGFFHRASLARLRPVINLRTHRKIIVCDDWTGFIGGINITDAEDERVTVDAYHDVHLGLYGDAVEGLQQMFWEDWYYATDEEPPRDAKLMNGAFPSAGKYIVQIIGSGPDTDWAPIHRASLAAISMAKNRVWLTTPYFVPDESAMLVLTNAALRGVDVRIMVPQRSDSRLVTLAARSYFDELTRAGVVIYEFNERMLHSKTMVIDDILATVGTANFDNRSFHLNFEVCAFVYGETLAQALTAQFEEDAVSAKPVLKERQVSRFGRLGEAVARLLSPLL
ncbi:MAG: cardiolipin synthase [Burkholderiales bacterium]|jgi:cardiolipin synthase|nr:cardiolipin synthase [Burkholderiales bacterium]